MMWAEKETLRKKTKGNSKNQKQYNRNKNEDGPINILDMMEERINELKGNSVEISQTEMQREKEWRKYKRTSKDSVTISKDVIYT